MGRWTHKVGKASDGVEVLLAVECKQREREVSEAENHAQYVNDGDWREI